jgi:hypothetical protein
MKRERHELITDYSQLRQLMMVLIKDHPSHCGKDHRAMLIKESFGR